MSPLPDGSRSKELVVPSIISIAIMLVVLVPLTLFGGHQYSVYLNDRDIREREDDLDDRLSDLKTSIELHLMNLDSLDALLRSGDPQTVIDLYFLGFSEVIVESTPGVVGIIVVNDTGTLFAYPEDITVYTDDWRAITDGIPEVSEGLEEMMSDAEGRLIGPFQFYDGSPYMVAGEPVFDDELLWGFQAIIFNLTMLFRETGLLDQDLDFDLQFINPNGTTFFGKDLSGRDDLISKKMRIRNVEWEVYAVPEKGWARETTLAVILFTLGEVIISALLIIVVFLGIRNQFRLSRVVTDRTEQLETRSKSLAEEVEKRKRSQKELAEANRILEVSLKEVNTLLRLSRLHLEGQEVLEEVYGRAVKVIEHTLLNPEKQCIAIIFDKKAYTVDCPRILPLLYRTKIYANGVERGAIVVRCKCGAGEGPACELSKREKRVIDSIASQLGAISERWSAQQKEMEARSQAQFYLDLMSHDINNLHQGILINLELLRSGIITGEKKDSTITTSMDLTHRSIKLVKNVKLLSYLKDLKEPLRPIELNESIVESIKEVRSSFAGREVEINVDMPGDQMLILADTVVSEVFINVLNNGVKVQNKSPARIKVEVHPHGETIRVAISDHGPGIRDKDKGSLFERHTGKKADKLMSGIGLSLVKVLMDRYRGRVWIEDRVRERSEMGAKFVLEFQNARTAD
ncbi:MAG: ATP-binding protein [Thermoplasmatota archaeon]